jgi:glycosyltransferase involved in cell wall biosynthesis
VGGVYSEKRCFIGFGLFCRSRAGDGVEAIRVLLVTSAYPPFLQFGGQPQTAASLARELARMGHRVNVLTANHKLGRPGLRGERDGVGAHYLKSIARYRSAGTLNPAVFSAARRLVRGADVVHLFGMYDLLGPAAAGAARRIGAPYLLEPLGMFRPIVRCVRKKRLYHRLIGRRLAAGAAGLVATSELEREELLREGVPPGRIFVRPNGVDLSAFLDPPARGGLRDRQGIPRDAPLILFLSRLAPIKRPELVVEALAMQADPSTRAVFIGPDEDGTRALLERRAAGRGVSDRVVLTGPMYGRDKLEALVDADVLVLPSESENFGNVVLEALASGLPVVVSNRCGLASVIDRRVGYVVPPDVPRVAEAVGRVLGDRGIRGRAAKEGPAIAARYSWESVAARMEEIYRSAL